MQSLIALLLIAISLGGFFGYISPTWHKVQDLKQQVVLYNNALQNANEAEQLADALKTKYLAFSDTDIENLKKALPDTVDNIRLLLDLSQLALTYGVNLTNIRVADSSETTQPKQTLTDDKTKPNYSALGIMFNVKMPYNDFLKFMRDIEHNLRLTDVISIVFKSEDTGVYEYTVTLKTYWLK